MLVDTTLQALNTLTDLLERAAKVDGRPRERLLALIEAEELFVRLHPYHYRALQLVRIASQFGRPPGRTGGLECCRSRRIVLLMDIIRDAVQQGELVLADERRPEDVAFMLWSLAFGTRALMNTLVATTQLGLNDGFRTMLAFVDQYLDALGWQPLAREWDYEQTRRRVRLALFPQLPRRLQVPN